MYLIEQTGYGFIITLSGELTAEEAAACRDACNGAAQSARAPFGVLVDARTLKAFPGMASPYLVEAQQRLLDAGLERSALILRDFDTTALFKAVAEQSGLGAQERVFSASKVMQWDVAAVRWLEEGVEP
jgi:hypothetical protein